MATCYKAFHRRVVPSLDLESQGFGIDAEITAKVARGGLPRLRGARSRTSARSRAEGKKIRLKDGFSALGGARPALASGGPRSVERRRGRRRPRRSRSSPSPLVAVRDHTRRDALSADEPIHILSGYLEVFGRTAIVNIEHPPLMKALAGLGLAALAAAAAARARSPWASASRRFGHAFLFENRVSPDAIAAAARAPFPGVLAALLAARLLRGAGALRRGARRSSRWRSVALDPNLVAHAGVVHTDLGAALGVPRDRARLGPRAGASPTPARLAAARRSCLGLALTTKFSVRLPAPDPAAAGARSAARRREAGAGRRRAALAAAGSRSSSRRARRRLRRLRGRHVAHGPRPTSARSSTRWSARPRRTGARRARSRGSRDVSPPLGALPRRARRRSRGRTRSAAASTSSIGQDLDRGVSRAISSWRFCAKSSLAFLAGRRRCSLAGCVVGGRRAREDGALFLLPVGVLFLASIGTSYNIGIRHLLPVYPFLALAAARRSSRASWRGARGRPRGRRPLALCAAARLSARRARCASTRTSCRTSTRSPAGPEAGARDPLRLERGLGPGSRRLGGELKRRGVDGPDGRLLRRRRRPLPDRRARLLGGPGRARAARRDLGVPAGRRAPSTTRTMAPTDVAAALEALRREIAARGRPVGPRRLLDRICSSCRRGRDP